MPVIKSHNASPLVKEAIVLDLGDLGRQAARMRAEAEAKAARIVEEAQREAQQLIDSAEAKGHEQGRAAGYEEGLAAGREQGRAEALQAMNEQLAQLQAGWAQTLSQWQAQREQVEREAKEAVLAFALKAVKKLVHRVVETDPAVVVDQVAEALTHVLRPLDVTVHIHPDDRPLLEASLPDLLAAFAQVKHIQLVDDDKVGRGGCTVSFGQGHIDATIETQLTRLAAAMLPESNPEPPPPPEAPPEGSPEAHG